MIVKPRKHGLRLRRRRQTTFLVLFSILLMLIATPFVWHMERLRQATSAYDIENVKEQLEWWEVHGGLLNKLGFIKDTELWLDLTTGSEKLESNLLMYQDDKHRFWLMLLNLREGKMTEAQNVLGLLGNSPLGQLGQGLMSLLKGDAEESRRLLTRIDVEWGDLPRHEQALRHLTLAQAAMIMGDSQSTQNEFEAAQRLEPNNPACLAVAFDMAIEKEQWLKAQEISRLIVAQTWRPKNLLFETKRAVLAIRENNTQQLTDSLSVLEKLPQGEASISYLKGIDSLTKGELPEGKNLLERALKNGLDGQLKADAQQALKQVTERQKADQALRSIVDLH